MTPRKTIAAIAAAAIVGGGGAAMAASSFTPQGGATYTPVVPTRIVDTRNGTGVAQGSLKAGASLTFTPAGVPSGAAAVTVNLTVTGSTGGGNVAVDPDGVAQTSTSNINFSQGQTVANQDTVAVGADGKVRVFYNGTGSTQVIVDLEGYYGSGAAPAPSSTTPVPTTSSPAPTTTSPSPTATGTATGLPAAPAGFTDVFYDSFTKVAPVGTFGTQDGGTVVYTGDHGGGWTSYPDGWSSTYTNGQPGYQPAQVASVDSNGLDFYLHNVNGLPSGANLHPLVNPSGATPGYFAYGRYSIRLKLSNYSPDYHVVPLLWPKNDSDWQSAESDFPEFGTDQGASVDAYAHYGGSGSQDDFGTPNDVLNWHTYSASWTPTGTTYYVDGVSIGTSTHRTWSQPERLQLQMEPSGKNSNTPTHVYVSSVEVDQWNG